MIVPARKTYKVTTEKSLPMKTRDGVTLYADVIRPDAPGRFPVLLSRTPYNKKGSDDPNGAGYLFSRYGYISVMQDCRGRFESEGEYDTIFQESRRWLRCGRMGGAAAVVQWPGGNDRPVLSRTDAIHDRV